MDYLTCRDITRIYGTTSWWSVSVLAPFPRLSSAGPRAIFDRENQRYVVPRREVEQAFADLDLTDVVTLPGGDPLDANALEALLAQAGLEPIYLWAKADAFLNLIAGPARERRIRAAAATLFTDDAWINEWLATPAPALNGKKPIELLATDAGTLEVEDLLRLLPDLGL